MKKVSSTNLVYAFSSSMSPVLEVASGDQIVFETIDALGGQIKFEGDVINLDFSKVNPATGPVFIKGAMPGNTLKVKILKIDLAEEGVIVCEEGFGVFPELVKGFKAKMLRIKDGFVRFDKLSIPANPMIGVIGVAPENGHFTTGTAYKHGGNMDTKYVKTGSAVYLPIFQPGACLALGDVHAAMADGEVCVSACEVCANVTVEVELINYEIEWPLIETENGFFIVVSMGTVEEALKEVTYQAVKFLSRKLNLSMNSAYMLASLVVDIQISQLVDPNKTVRAYIPKYLFDGKGEIM